MTAARRRWWPLAALTLAVLAAHLLALRAVPGVLRLAPASAAALQVRTIAPAAVVQEPDRPAVRVQPRPVAPEKIAPAPLPAPQPPPVPAAATVEAASPPPPPAATLAVPGSARWRYQVQARYRGFTVAGQAELLWRHDGSNYEARLETSAPMLPARIQRSTGRITAEGLAPLRFSDRARSEEAAHFDREAGKVMFSTNRPEAALLPGAQDRLSVLLQLGALIAGDPARFGPGTDITVQTAGTREADLWLFTVEGEEELALAGGAVRGLKLTRLPRKEFDQKLELWLGPGLDYAPVRLRLTQPNGDWLDLQWSATDKG